MELFLLLPWVEGFLPVGLSAGLRWSWEHSEISEKVIKILLIGFED